MSKRIVLMTIVSLALALSAYGREGFGFTKKAVEMTKTVPPAINVAGTRVNVAVDAEHTRISGKAETLRQYTEAEILAGDKRLQAVPKGDVDVTVALDRLDAAQHWQSKTEDNYEKTKDKDGKTTYVNHPKTKSFKTVRGEVGGTYKITDAKGRLLDSGDIDQKFEKDYEYGGEPTNDKLQDQLLRDAADKIASRIVPTQVKVNVIMPKGSFEQYIPLAESGAWDRYLQGVQTVRPMGDRASDAFREYALGVAKEALAYSAPDAKQGLELLRAAAEHYRTAAADNPNEKLFSEAYTSLFNSAAAPVARAEKSIKAYEAWTSGPTPPMATPAVASRAPASKAAALRNQNVIEMAKAGLSDENIMLAIDSADAVEFDTTPDGLIALSKAGVSKSVIAHMQKHERK